MTQIILRVKELKVQTDYAKSSLTCNPFEDILYAINVSDDMVENLEDGIILNVAGIRHIIKGMHVALVLDADE